MARTLADFVNNALRLFGREVVRVGSRTRPRSDLHFRHFLALYFKHIGPDFFFINIGANDGRNKDPLYEFVKKYRSRGIMVEPQADVFKHLQENFRNIPSVRCIRAAIARQDGMQTLYTARDSLKTKEHFLSVTGNA